MIPGVIVGVNVELNPEVQHSIATVKLDPKPVTVSSTRIDQGIDDAGAAGRRPARAPAQRRRQPAASHRSQTGCRRRESQTTEIALRHSERPRPRARRITQRRPLIPRR